MEDQDAHPPGIGPLWAEGVEPSSLESIDAAWIEEDGLGPVDGTVVLWHRDEGWGVVAASDMDGEVWVHFSHITGDGYKSLESGQSVTFTYATPGQDGYPHRAVSVDRK